MRGEQHAVAEDVARHVADAGDGEVLGLDVTAELAEVTLDRLPRSACGYAHLLVVVSARPARGERVAQPEPVVARDRVGDVREGRRALVGGDDQVGVVVVVAHDVGRRDDLAVDDVVGHIEQAADEGAIAGHDLLEQRLAIARGRRALDHEATLRADRHDHRVLDHLGLHQTEHLGAEVLAPVRPADAATRDLPAAQVHTLDARGVDEDLKARMRERQPRQPRRLQLEREPRLGRPVR